MALRTLRSVLRDRVEEVADGVRRRGLGERVLTHVPTGLTEYDTEFGGLELGVLTLIVGHTGHGKSVVMKQLGQGAAQAGLASLLYFVEDPEKRTADRYLSTATGVSSSDLGKLRVDEHEIADLRTAVEEADWADRIGVRFGGISADEIMSDVERVREIGGVPVGLVGVDYAQALDGEHGLEETCARTAKALNKVACDRGMATVFGSQVKTEVISRGRDKYRQYPGDVSGFIPGATDAMWSTRLSQYAKAVMTLHRPGKWLQDMGEDARDDIMELHVPKQNFGPTGWVPMAWDGAHARIFSRK